MVKISEVNLNMVDCVLTNEAVIFWAFSVAVSLMLGWVARGREIERLNRRIKNLESLLTTLRRDLKAITTRDR